ncbi:MAG: mucoidy inhibitor MuiA family protein [Myxococcota bacterium]|nr:mucoidy inhibitor MuiA family protein [Myxococcota bacterium]
MSLILQSTITAVTIYRNGALVTRVGHIPAPKGPETLHIPGMPLLFTSDSLRIRVRGGTADAVEELPELAVVEGVTPEDKAALRALEAERGRLNRQRSAWRLRKASAERIAIQAVSTNEAPVLPDVGLWLDVDDMAEAEQDCSRAAITRLDARLEAIAEEVEALRRRQQAGRSTRYTRTLATTLTPTGRDAIEVAVDCFIPGARWTPVYRVYVDTAGSRARLWMGARVAQATGEDWSGVPIAVSTADLTRSARIPTLSSWRIGRAVSKPSRWRPLPEGLDGLFSDFDAAPKAPALSPPPSAPKPKHANVQHRVRAGRAPFKGDHVPKRRSPTPPPPAPPLATTGAMMPPAASMRTVRESSVGSQKPLRKRAKSSKAFGGMGGGSAPPEEAMPREKTLDPGRLLDYAWLRLAPAADRRRRGKLLPVELDASYRSFIEERGGDLSRYEAFSAALRALRKEQARLWLESLPSGCFDVRQSSFYHRYLAGPAVTIPSDGRFHQIAIMEADADCALLLRCVPRQAPQAFRYARLVNPLSSPLLPGPMQVYLDGAYTVTGRLSPVGAHGELRLNLGIEEQVRVARNAVFHQAERGMITSTSSLEHRIHTEVRSRLSGPVEVEVFERLPQAEEGEGIELTLDETRPEPKTVQDPDGRVVDGALCWKLSLPAGGSADIHYRYTIEISARKELIGGNRREP